MFNICFEDHRMEELYKAARGIDPLPEMVDDWNSMIDPEKQTIWEMLLEELAPEEYRRWKDSAITTPSSEKLTQEEYRRWSAWSAITQHDLFLPTSHPSSEGFFLSGS